MSFSVVYEFQREGKSIINKFRDFKSKSEAKKFEALFSLILKEKKIIISNVKIVDEKDERFAIVIEGDPMKILIEGKDNPIAVPIRDLNSGVIASYRKNLAVAVAQDWDDGQSSIRIIPVPDTDLELTFNFDKFR